MPCGKPIGMVSIPQVAMLAHVQVGLPFTAMNETLTKRVLPSVRLVVEQGHLVFGLMAKQSPVGNGLYRLDSYRLKS